MNLKRLKLLLAAAAAFCLLLGVARHAAAQAWPTVGPDGGDARRFATDPRNPAHIYLGTTDSWVYESNDGGSSWSRLARLGAEDNLVVDSLIVNRRDPRTVYAGAWEMDRPGGGVFVSHDSGRTWTQFPGMDGQSVRALAEAPSNPRVLVAGTLKGVFRSDDQGLHWRQISPVGSTEIHEVESIAVDPYDPNTIYAGTWHLPWKTQDDGRNWTSIRKGVIDDSDVFSIIIDPSRPTVIYASACSGIYRSDSAGTEFRKVQGIPSTARRTRALMMDPSNRSIVYAGTTEGLYKTADGGTNWTRTTGPDVIVNDVYIDPRNPKHVLLATDRGGVLASEDSGVSFQASNTGFSQRQVAALVADSSAPGTLYAGVVNDKQYGGVFVTTDFGHTWKQRSEGLKGRDVFLLGQSNSGVLVAGTSDGVLRWDGSQWVASDEIKELKADPPVWRAAGHSKAKKRVTARSRHASAARRLPAPGQITGRVTALDVSGPVWFAATGQGLFRSENQGQSWDGPVLPPAVPGDFSTANAYRIIAEQGPIIYAGRRQAIMMSTNRGVSWHLASLPVGLHTVQALAVAGDGSVWAGGNGGLFYSMDQGRSWMKLDRLPVSDVTSLQWDAALHRIMATSGQSTVIFALDPSSKGWKWWNPGWTVRSVTSAGGRLAAASLYSGVVTQPEPETASAGGHAAQPVER